MTENSERAFQDFYSKTLSFKVSQGRFEDACIRTMKDAFGEKDCESAERAVWKALEPFRRKYELEIYKAAKKFVETYEANDLVK